jgi:hypothetical protein
MKSVIFWDITPCSPLNVNRCFGGTYDLHLQGLTISPARYQRESRQQAEPTLKMETIYSSKTSVDFQWTIQRYIPIGSNLHTHHYENLKSYMMTIMLDHSRGHSNCIYKKVKMYGGLDAQNRIFLTLALVEGEWSASRPSRFTHTTHQIGGWMDRRASLADVENRKFLILMGLLL